MPKTGFRTISWSSGSPVFYFPCSKSDLLFWNGYYAAISKIIRGGRIRTWKSIKTWASRIVLLYVNIQISPSPPWKKPLLSTGQKWSLSTKSTLSGGWNPLRGWNRLRRWNPAARGDGRISFHRERKRTISSEGESPKISPRLRRDFTHFLARRAFSFWFSLLCKEKQKVSEMGDLNQIYIESAIYKTSPSDYKTLI